MVLKRAGDAPQQDMSVCAKYQSCPHECAFDLRIAAGPPTQNTRELDGAIRYLFPNIPDEAFRRLQKPMNRWRSATEAFLAAPICPLLDRKYAAVWIDIYADAPRSQRPLITAMYAAIDHHIDELLKTIRPERKHRHWWALMLLLDYLFPGTGDRLALERRAEREARHA